MLSQTLERTILLLERTNSCTKTTTPAQKLAQVLRNRFNLFLTLSPDAKKVLKYWCIRDNPRDSEIAFFGVGKGNFVDDIYSPDDFSPESNGEWNVLPNGTHSYSTQVAPNEESDLINQILNDGRMGDILLKGHLHPSILWKTDKAGYITPNYDLSLLPSEWDIFVKANTPELTQAGYDSILGLSRKGPVLKIYRSKDIHTLRDLTYQSRRRMPHQYVRLDK